MESHVSNTRIIVAITGASGSIYAQTLLAHLLKHNIRTYLVFTHTAKKVIVTECANSFLDALSKTKLRQRLEKDDTVVEQANNCGLNINHISTLKIFDVDDLYAPIASGSEGATHMVVCPSSMGMLSRIAHGFSGNLIERAADVMLKERRPLLVVPRETPLSLIHLQNMVQLTQAGAHIIPAMPAFYHNPKTIADCVQFVVERIIDALKLDTHMTKSIRWNHTQL